MSISEAVKNAIEVSKEAFSALEKEANSLVNDLRTKRYEVVDFGKMCIKGLEESESDSTDESQGKSEELRIKMEEVINVFADMADKNTREIEDLFKRQKELLGTFKIVLFGRTGAGKSTHTNSFIHGNGESISNGNTDWTKEISSNHWKSCEFIDTPGIGGWNNRESLEKKAQQAAETSDIVLLCFDNSNYTTYELDKVAKWVAEYGKAAIVVFNVKNRAWRQPYEAKSVAIREQLSRSVYQLTSSLKYELRKIGLMNLPIVALNSKRALFSRLSDFKGPYESEGIKASILEQRKKYGLEKLEEWSNFKALEDLIIEAITFDAAGLRLGMLTEQTRSIFTRMKAELSNELEMAKVT